MRIEHDVIQKCAAFNRDSCPSWRVATFYVMPIALSLVQSPSKREEKNLLCAHFIIFLRRLPLQAKTRIRTQVTM